QRTLDDRKSPRRAQSLDNIARRVIGNNGEGTLQRHLALDVLSDRTSGRTTELANTAADPAKVLLTAGQRSLKKLRLWRPHAPLQRLSLQRRSGRTPPAVGEKAEQRGPRRVLDGRAARHPLLGEIEQRHDIGAGNQHAVERA